MHTHMYVMTVVLASYVAEMYSFFAEHTSAAILAAIISSMVGSPFIHKQQIVLAMVFELQSVSGIPTIAFEISTLPVGPSASSIALPVNHP